MNNTHKHTENEKINLISQNGALMKIIFLASSIKNYFIYAKFFNSFPSQNYITLFLNKSPDPLSELVSKNF